MPKCNSIDCSFLNEKSSFTSSKMYRIFLKVSFLVLRSSFYPTENIYLSYSTSSSIFSLLINISYEDEVISRFDYSSLFGCFCS